jgi:serine protease Do
MSNENGTEKKSRGWLKWIVVLGSGILIGAAVAVVFIMVKTGNKKQKSVLKSDVKSESDVISSTDEDIVTENVSSSMKVTSSDVSDIAESVLPAVVSIDCVIESSYSDMFDDMFGYGYGFGYNTPRTYETTASGTGFIIGQNGDELLIATNNHVVEDANKVSVEFVDGKTASATVKGTDSAYDVAVISVDISDIDSDTLGKIKIATIGDSDIVKVGDMSIAIGNSLGYGQSVTVGHISALEREVKTEDNKTMTLMQTDTIINHGNSGGPLLNIYGEVIGITSAKYGTSSSGKAEGMCFAIPITKVVPIINELMNRVELSPSEVGYLGIDGKEVNDSYSKAFSMPKGLYIYSVDKDSAAYKAGLKSGDIITSIDGRAISTMEELKNILSYKKYDTEIEIIYSTMGNSGYEDKKIKVKLGKKSVFDKSGSN